MADPADVQTVRRLSNIPSPAEPYTDQFLSDLIDGQGIFGAISTLWEEKAAQFVLAVDTTESGSSRKLSQLRENALAMAAHYRARADSAGGGSFTVAIERP